MVSREAVLAAAAAHLDSGAFERRPGAPHRHPQRQPGRRQRPGAAGLPGRRTGADAGGAGLSQPHPREPGGGQWPVPDRQAHRGPGPPHGADVRPRRRDPRPGRDVDTRRRAVDAGARRRPALRPRHAPTTRASTASTSPRWRTVLRARGGRLGFNVTWLFETGEETGSPGLAEFCAAQRDALAADVLIASDGPRLRADAADGLPRLARGNQLRRWR